MPLISMTTIQIEMTARYGLLLLGLIVLAIVGVFLYVYKMRADTKRLLKIQKWLDKIRSQKGYEQKLAVVLDAVSHQFTAPSYALYILDMRFDKFILKASHHQSRDIENIELVTSGLLQPTQDMYKPEMSAPKLFMTNKVEIMKDGEVPLLVLPIGDKGIIRVGPINQISGSTRRKLKNWMSIVKPMVNEMIEAEQAKEQAYVALTSKSALDKISKIALKKNKAIEQILPFCAHSTNAAGGCLVEYNQRRFMIQASTGMQSDFQKQFTDDQNSLLALHKRSGKEGIFFINQTSDHNEAWPQFFAQQGFTNAVIASLGVENNQFLVFWFNGLKEQTWVELLLKTLTSNVEEFTRAQSSYLNGSGSYIPLLQSLARLVDDLNPFTVGYSELLSRYSIVIAKELGLPDRDIRDIGIAAYLSHIGTIALSSDLVQKDGQYTEGEFELMKLHAEIGALIVAFATGNERIAAYIRHHHERIDGNGYPERLKGEETPHGAKIIAVVQTFLAKLNGRNYRDPLYFDQALHTIKMAAGKQLDTQMVNLFIRWFTEKRHNQIDSKKSLGNCSEMCCVPEVICQSCPAYGRTDVNCWEVEGNLCRAHGKSCESCFVKTEYLSRDKVTVKQ